MYSFFKGCLCSSAAVYPPEEETGFSICITHVSTLSTNIRPVILNGLKHTITRSTFPKGYVLQVLCVDKKFYIFGMHTTYDKGHVKSQKIIQLKDDSNDASAEEPLLLSSDEFKQYIQVLKKRYMHNCRVVTMLCADANLSQIGGEMVTQFFKQIVCAIRPEYLIAFSNTERCIEDANLYVSEKLKNPFKVFTKSNSVKDNIVCARQHIAAELTQMMERHYPQQKSEHSKESTTITNYSDFNQLSTDSNL